MSVSVCVRVCVSVRVCLFSLTLLFAFFLSPTLVLTKPFACVQQVAPVTIHPAFHKGGAYFNVRIKTVPVGDDMRSDVKAMEAAIGPNTIAIAVSAPQNPHGVCVCVCACVCVRACV